MINKLSNNNKKLHWKKNYLISCTKSWNRSCCHLK